MVRTDIILCDNIEDKISERRNTRDIIFALAILKVLSTSSEMDPAEIWLIR